MCVYSDSLNKLIEAINQIGNINWLDVVTLIISTGSLIFAVLVPVRIANKENKTALFEKRFNTYIEITKLIKFSDLLKEIKDKNLSGDLKAQDVIERFSSVFNCVLSNGSSVLNYENRILPTIEENKNSAKTIVFLYNKTLNHKQKDIGDVLENIYLELKNLLKVACKNQEYNSLAADSFIKYLDDFIKNYKNALEKPLKL